MDDQAARERVARLDSLLERLEVVADPAARAVATETVQALLELYGEALARVLEHAARPECADLSAALVRDELVSHLLLLHGLHPVPVAVRVAQALDGVREYLRARGGAAELLRVEEGIAYLRLESGSGGRNSSGASLRRKLEEAVQKAAPDLERIEVEVVSAPSAPVFVPISALGIKRTAGAPAPREHA